MQSLSVGFVSKTNERVHLLPFVSRAVLREEAAASALEFLKKMGY